MIGVCSHAGSALPTPFLDHELEPLLHRLGAMSSSDWPPIRPAAIGADSARVRRQVLAPLARALGYDGLTRQDPVVTREGAEDGGWLAERVGGASLRVWTIAAGAPPDSPLARGHAYRFSPSRIAHRVLRARGEIAGLLTDGIEIRLLIADPALPDSHVGFALDDADPAAVAVLRAMVGAGAGRTLTDVLDAARLYQSRVTQDLRVRARAAIEGFVQGVLDHPANRALLPEADQGLAETLWAEGLILIYRLLFILKLESGEEAGRGFGFAGTELWRSSLSPNRALGPLARRRMDHGQNTGRMLEDGLRQVFRLFRDGISTTALCIAPLGGALFDTCAMPRLEALAWGEDAVAHLLDQLLWTRGTGGERARVHYGSLDVEELGRVYEALLELEPGLARRTMRRTRRGKQEVVARAVDGPTDRDDGVETIPAGRFFLRAGLGRKATGAYYTPHTLVAVLVRETLGPLVARDSPDDNPDPAAILALRVVDPATGSGHFLIEACRFLADALYAACCLCDSHPIWRDRLAALPDPDGILASYLPSRACPNGLSEGRALALCRRLVAVNCLYGADRNPLAVTLAKVSLWLESHAEGLPLTFLDHRLIVGDSLSGPLLPDLRCFPVGGRPLDPLFAQTVHRRLDAAHAVARRELPILNGSLGRDVADLRAKQDAKARLDAAMASLRVIARAWSGAAMLGRADGNDAWLAFARATIETPDAVATCTERQAEMLAVGEQALPWDTVFPDVFARDGLPGFDVVLGNPPWETLQYRTSDFVGGLDVPVPDPKAGGTAERRVLDDPAVAEAFAAYKQGFDRRKRLFERLYRHQRTRTRARGATAGTLDTFRLFAERAVSLAGERGAIGLLVPSAFHANEGATAIRALYLQRMRLDLCLSFENRRRLFDIDSRFRFDLIVARQPGPTAATRCAFYLDSIDQIDDPARLMTYDAAFVARVGGDHLSFLELRGPADLAIARRMFAAPDRFADWCAQTGVRFGRDLHMTYDASAFRPLTTGEDLLTLHEGKTFHQFVDRWDTAPRYGVSPAALRGKPGVAEAAGWFRLAFRDIAKSTDEHTMIAAVLPPGTVCGHTATVERRPWQRAPTDMLTLCAILNAHPFEWLVRQKAGSHLSLYLLDALPMPVLSVDERALLSDLALRLSCNHAGFVPLWRAVADRPWNPLIDPGQRWRARAEADAIVALGYGLDRSAYARMLASFSHRSFPSAPSLCLAAYDARARAGMPGERLAS